MDYLRASTIVASDRTGLADNEFRFQLTTGDIDRQGVTLDVDALDLTDFNASPLVFVSHDTDALPVGTVKDVQRNADGLEGTVVLDTADPVAERAQGKIQRGLLRHVSIGAKIDDKEFNRKSKSWHVTAATLREVSLAPIPADSGAALLASWTPPDEDEELDPDIVRRIEALHTKLIGG